MSIKIILRSFFFPICILFGICGYTQNGNRVRVFYDTETGTMKRIASRIEDTIYVKFDFTLPEEVSGDIRKTEDGGAVIFSAGSKAAGRTDEFLFDATRGMSGMRKLSLKEFRRLKFTEISALNSLPDMDFKAVDIVEITRAGDTVLYRNVSWRMTKFMNHPAVGDSSGYAGSCPGDTVYVEFRVKPLTEKKMNIKFRHSGRYVFAFMPLVSNRGDDFLFDTARRASDMRKLSLKDFRRLKFTEVSALDSLPDIKSKVINIVEISDKGDTVLYRNVSWEISDFIYPIKRVAPPGYVPDKDALKDTVYVKFDFKSFGKMTSERIHKFKNRGKIIFCVGEETMGRMDEFLFDTVRRASDMRKLSLKDFRRLKFREVFVLDTLPDIKYRRIHVVEVPEEGDTLLYRNVRWERVFYTE